MTDVIGRRIAGNLTYIDQGAHLKRVIDAIGPDVIKYVDDFVGGTGLETAFPDDWTVTLTEAGADESTVTRGNEAGGTLVIKTDENENDGLSMQLIGESFKLAAGNVLYFGARLKLSDATQSDFFVGLAITDTDILGGVTDRIGFQKLDGSTDVKAMLEKDNSETLTAALLTADTSYHILEFYLDADGVVEIFVDGVSAATPAVTNLPDDEELRVTVEMLAGAAAVGGKTLTVDWIRCIQIGGRA